MTSETSRAGELLIGFKKGDRSPTQERPFQSRSKSALALLFVVAVLFWALVVPMFGQSLISAVLQWLQPLG